LINEKQWTEETELLYQPEIQGDKENRDGFIWLYLSSTWYLYIIQYSIDQIPTSTTPSK